MQSVKAVADAMRDRCPIRPSSPKKVPSLNIAMVASFPPGRQQSTSPGPSGYGRPRGRRRLGQRLLSFRKTTESFYLCQSWPEMPLRQTSAVCVSWEAYVLSRIDQPGGQIADYRRSGDHEGGGSDSISVVHYVKTSAQHTGKDCHPRWQVPRALRHAHRQSRRTGMLRHSAESAEYPVERDKHSWPLFRGGEVHLYGWCSERRARVLS